MKTMLSILFVAISVAGCNRPDVVMPSVTVPSGEAQATLQGETQGSKAPTTEEWLNNPLLKKRNPYDLPLEYEIEVPELPPAGVMAPGPKLPPEGS